MNRRNKRLICAAMTCLMLWSMAAAEDAPAEPETSAPVEKATEAPIKEPEAEATKEPEGEATEKPETEETPEPEKSAAPEETASPEEDASAEPTAEPSLAPTQQPAGEPSFEPTLEPTVEPTIEPTIEPTTEPTPEPTPEPTATIEIYIGGEGAQKDSQEIWQIPVNSPEAQIEFEWSSVEGASTYDVQFTDSQQSIVLAQQTAETKLTLRASELGEGSYTLTVRALGMAQGEAMETEADGNDENELAELARGEIRFMLSSGGAFPDGFPAGGFPSGRGGLPAGAGMQEEQGFRVVPGEPLTSDHSSGNKDMSLYGTVKLSLPENEMTALTLDNTQLDITLGAEAQSFTAQIWEDRLVLTPSREGGAWRVNALALKTLKRSGVSALCLETDAGEKRIDTQIALQGEAYARLCMQGFVSKDYTFIIDGDSIWVEVDGQIYTINENNELVGG